MMTEAQLRQRLADLDALWNQEIQRRHESPDPIPPVDFYWYTYTRDAYIEVLGDRRLDDEEGGD